MRALGKHTENRSTKMLSKGTTANLNQGNGGDYLIEINGNVLNVYGQGALRFIDRPWNTSKAKEVTTVKFSYLDFNYISLILGRVKYRFPKAENYCFVETNIYCLGQINALADIQGLTSLTIEKKGNPISEKEWRSYAIYRLSHWGLKTINESQVWTYN
ncbi:unnamed protein product [Nezara viridula]|uniref:Uncharacterized protein n=1 Tax=Nezara viridula TaxID=85310 RepID=A0A9P0E9B3_NEZVI|nr:unnamed protein product [Nezara viridula]